MDQSTGSKHPATKSGQSTTMAPPQLPRTVPQKNIVRTIRIDPSKMGAGLQSQLLASVSTARNARRISFAAAAAAPASPAAATTTATVVSHTIPATATPAPTSLTTSSEPDPATANLPSSDRLAQHTELSTNDDDAGRTTKPQPAAGASAGLFRRKKVVPIVVAKKLAKKPSPALITPAAKTEGEETEERKSSIRSESSQSEALVKIDVESAASSTAPKQPKPVAFRRVKPKVSLATGVKPSKTATKRIDPSKDSTGPEVTDGSQRQGSLSTVEVAPDISVATEEAAKVNQSRSALASLQTKQNPLTNEAVVSEEQVIAIESRQEGTVDPVATSPARSEPIKDGARIVGNETTTPDDLAQEDAIANNLLLDSPIDPARVENVTVAIGNVNETAVPTHRDKENISHPHLLHTTSDATSQPGLSCATLSSNDCNRPPEETTSKIAVTEKSAMVAQSPIIAKTTTSTPTSGSKTIKRTFSLGKLLPPELANKLKNSLVQTSSTKRKPEAKTNTVNAPDNNSGHNIDNTVCDQSSDKKALAIVDNEVGKQIVLPLDVPVKTNGSSTIVACSSVPSSGPSAVELASKNDSTRSVESLKTPETSCTLGQKVVADGTVKNETTTVSRVSGASKQIRKIRYLTPSQKQLFMQCFNKGGVKPSTSGGSVQKGNAEPKVTPHPEGLEKSDIKASLPTITIAPALQSQITVLTTSANTHTSVPPVQQKLRIISQIILPTIQFTPTKASQPASPGLSGITTGPVATGASGSPEISSSAFAPFPSRSLPSPSANPTVVGSNLIRAGPALPFLVSPDFRLMHIPFSSTSTPQQRLNDVVPMASGSGSKLIVPQTYPGAASEMYPKILVLHRPGLAKEETAPNSTTPQQNVPRIVIDRSYIGETEQPMECTSSKAVDEPTGDHEQQSLKGCSEAIRDMVRKKALQNLHDRGEKVPVASVNSEAVKVVSPKKQLQIPVPRYGRCYSNSARNKTGSTVNAGTPYISVATVDGRKEYVKLEDHITQDAKVPSDGPPEVKPFGISTTDPPDGKNSDNEFYGYSDQMIEWENAQMDAKKRFIDRIVEQMVPIPAPDEQTTSESDTDDGSIDETVDAGSDTEETIEEPETGPSMNDASSTVPPFCMENASLVPQELALTDKNAQNSAVIDIQNAPIIIPLGGQKTLVIPAPQSEATITHEPNTLVVAETRLPQSLQQREELQTNKVIVEEAPTTSVPSGNDLNEQCVALDTEQQREYTAVDAILDFENARKEGDFDENRDSSSSKKVSSNTTPDKVQPSSVCSVELETPCTSRFGEGNGKKSHKKSGRKRRDRFVELLLRHVNYDSLIGELVEREKQAYGITNLGTSDESEAEQLQRSPLERYIRERARTTFSFPEESHTSPSLTKDDEDVATSDSGGDDMDAELVSEILKPFVRDQKRDSFTAFTEQVKTEPPHETGNDGTDTPSDDRTDALIQQIEQNLTADGIESKMEDTRAKESVETMSKNPNVPTMEIDQPEELSVALHKTLESDTANVLEAMVSEECESIPDSFLEEFPQSDDPDSAPAELVANAEEETPTAASDPIVEDSQPLPQSSSVESVHLKDTVEPKNSLPTVPYVQVVSQPPELESTHLVTTDASETVIDQKSENTVPASEPLSSNTFSPARQKQDADQSHDFDCSSRQPHKTSPSSIISPFSVSKEAVDEVVSDCSSPGFSNFEDAVAEEDSTPTKDVLVSRPVPENSAGVGGKRKRRRNDSVSKEALIDDEILMPARRLRPRQTPVQQSTPKRGGNAQKSEVTDMPLQKCTSSEISEVTPIAEPIEEKTDTKSSRESLLEKGKRRGRSRKHQRRGSGNRSISSSSSSSCRSRSRSSSNDRNAKIDHDDLDGSSDSHDGSPSRRSVKNRKKILRKKRQSKTPGKSGNSLLDVVRSAGLKISASMTTPRVTSPLDDSVTAPTAAPTSSTTTATSNPSKTFDSDEQFVISEVVDASTAAGTGQRVMEIVNVHTTHVLPDATPPIQAVPKKRGRKSAAELQALNAKEAEKQKVSVGEAANGAAASTETDHGSSYECARCSKTIPGKNWDEHFILHNGLTYRVGIDNELALNDLTVASMLLQRFMKRFRRTELICERCGDRKKSYMGMASHIGRCGVPQEKLGATKVRCEHCNRLMLPISMAVHLANHCQVLKTKQRLEDTREKQSKQEEVASLIVEQTASGRQKRQSVACAEKKIKQIVQEATSTTTPKELLISISPGMISPGTRKLWETQIKFKGVGKCMYPKCTFTASTAEELESHHGQCWVGAESNADTFFECAICCQQSPRRERIRKHIQRQHPRELEEAGGSASDSDGFVGQTDGSETTDDSGGSGTATDAADDSNLQRSKRAKIAAVNVSKRGKGRPTPVSRRAATPSGKTPSAVNDSMDIDDSLLGDKDELEVYKDMILDEAYEYKSQKTDFSQTCIKLMRQFHRAMYGTRLLFEHLKPHTDLRLMSQQAVKEYLPRATRSMRYRFRQVKTYDERYNDSLSDGWERLQTFQSQPLGCQESVFYCGGPVTAMAWLPMPCEEMTDLKSRNQSPSDQILAIACKSSYNEYYNGEQLAARPQRKCLIQIWNTGPLLNTLQTKTEPMKTPSPPQLSFAIACDFGPIFQLAFCPSGCYNDRSEGDSIDRLGLLAATGSDGDVYVYSLNRTLQMQPTESTAPPPPRILNLAPVLRLSITLTVPRQSPTADYTGHATLKIVWSRARGHTVFAAGFSNGVVAVWNLESRSSLLRGVKGGTPTLLPAHKLLHSSSGAITALDLHYDENSRYLVVGNSDRRLKVYDLRSGQHLPPEVCSLSVRSRCSAVRWMTHFPVLMMVFDDIFALDRCSLTVHQPREIGYRLFPALPFAAEATDLAPNDWLGINAVSTDGGDVLSHRPMPFVYHVHERKVIQMLTSTTTVRLSEGDGEVDLSTYEAYSEHCGILFSDTDRVRDRSDTKSLQVKVLRRAAVDKYSATRTTQVSFNPNSSSFYYYAIGYQAGFVRIRGLRV